MAMKLQLNVTVTSISCMQCHCQDGAAILSRGDDEADDHLSVCLSVYSNRITRDGAKQLAELLKCDTTLSVLDLGFNRIGDDGATAIADALALRNRTLKA